MNTNERNGMFDSIKGIAMIGIMLVHLGGWNSLFISSNILSNISVAGALGVELTLFINGFFYTKSYNNRVKSGNMTNIKFLLKLVLRIMPVYYLALIGYGITTYLSTGTLGVTKVNLLSHFLFLNALQPSWWNGYMGGSGYIGVLVLIWFIYVIVIRKIDRFEDSLMFCIILCIVFYAIMIYATLLNNKFCFNDPQGFVSWLSYIWRGVVGFSIGNLFYYIYNNKDFINRFSKYKWQISILGGAFLIEEICRVGRGISSPWFVLIWMAIVIVNIKKPIRILNNRFFAYIGKYSMEVYVLHILLYYVLERDAKILQPGWMAFLFIVGLSLLLSPVVNILIQRPINNRILSKF